MTREKSKDAGLALTLILLLAALKFDSLQLVAAAAMAVLLCMVVPQFFVPFGWLWYGLARLLAPVMSRVLLTIIYVAIVVPVGGLRRLFGADSMAGKQWRQDRDTVFVERNHTFTRQDIETPY